MPGFNALIIDDDIWMQRILSKTLKSYGFNNAYLASNGFEGVGLAVEHTPALIILDILMPELSGHMTLKILKNIKSTKHIPVLMVSAMSDTENLGMAVKSGTAGFISKPFTRATVFEKLLNIFGKEKMNKLASGALEEGDGLTEDEQSDEKTAVKEPVKVPVEKKTEEEKAPDITKQKSSKPKTSGTQLLKHYQDDEKRSIESIKKLLLKTRK